MKILINLETPSRTLQDLSGGIATLKMLSSNNGNKNKMLLDQIKAAELVKNQISGHLIALAAKEHAKNEIR